MRVYEVEAMVVDVDVDVDVHGWWLRAEGELFIAALCLGGRITYSTNHNFFNNHRTGQITRSTPLLLGTAC